MERRRSHGAHLRRDCVGAAGVASGSAGALDERHGSDLNDLYLDTFVLKVVPDRRTSLIVDPADGRLPAALPQAKARADARPKRSYDDPETIVNSSIT